MGRRGEGMGLGMGELGLEETNTLNTTGADTVRFLDWDALTSAATDLTL